MSFNIELINTTSEYNKLSKDLTIITTLTGTLKNATSILSPVINIECDISSLTNCNYMHIAEFNRYYFIEDITSISNSVVQISGRVDVLTTYAAQIRNNTAITRKQENKWNLYLNDGTFKTYQNPNVITYAFPSGFTTQELVLAVAGS